MIYNASNLLKPPFPFPQGGKAALIPQGVKSGIVGINLLYNNLFVRLIYMSTVAYFIT